MTSITRRTALGTIAVGVASIRSGRSLASDAKPNSAWASFRATPDQRGIANTSLAVQPRLLWEFGSRDGWVGTVAIAGDRIYAPALEGYLYCLDRKTGNVVWKYRSIDSKDEDEFAAGFKAAPLIIGHTVYAGDEDGFLHAVNTATGERRWKFETGAEIAGVAGSAGLGRL